MDRRTALGWWIRYRILSTVAFVLGAAVVLAGIWLGIRDAIQFALLNLVGEPDFVKATVARVKTGLILGFTIAGIVVWQVGNALAFYLTIGKALENATEAAPREEPMAREQERQPDRPPRGERDEDEGRTASGTTEGAGPTPESAADAGPTGDAEDATDGDGGPRR